MSKTEHPHFSAAKMAAGDLRDMLATLKDGDYGSFPTSGQDGRTIARKERIASLPEHQQTGGYTMEFLDRLARLAKED